MRKVWTEKEVEYLIQNFRDVTDEELSVVLKKTKSSISSKSRRLNLKKSVNHKSMCISKRNKMVGRDLNKKTLSEIAKKYKTRGDFQKSDSSAYSASRKLGIIDDICSHMVVQNYSIPQLILNNILEQLFDMKSLYNSRKIIPPYEIDIFFPCYNLGFEYDGKGWHVDNENDKIKIKLCEEKKIILIKLIENNRRYEEDIKIQLLEHLKLINSITNLKLTEDDVVGVKVSPLSDHLIDIKSINITISNYDTLKRFMKNEPRLYSKLVKMGRLDLLSTLKRERHIYNEIEIRNEIQKYEYLLDFIVNSKRYYLYIHRHGLQHLLTPLKRR